MAGSQTLIDATVQIRNRQREPIAGTGGGIGLEIPLLGAKSRHSISMQPPAKAEIEFTLTNVGKEFITIPISPHPRDFEPQNPQESYSLECLSLRILPAAGPAAVLPGGADLFGSSSVSGSMKILSPGESVRVLTLVTLPSISTMPEASGFIAMAMLTDRKVAFANGRFKEDPQEICSARSPQFKLAALRPQP